MTYREDCSQLSQYPQHGYGAYSQHDPQLQASQPRECDPWLRQAAWAPWKPQPPTPMHRKPRRKRDVIVLSAAGLIAIIAIASAVLLT